MTDYAKLTAEFRKMHSDAQRAITRARKRHGIALIKRMSSKDERTTQLVETTWTELAEARMSLEQAESALAGVKAHEKVVRSGDLQSDPDISDLFD